MNMEALPSAVFCVLLWTCCLNSCDGYKALVVFPFPIRSLNLLGAGYVHHLLNAGHEVTYISVFPLKNKPNKNFRHIDVSDNFKLFDTKDDKDILDVSYIMQNDVQQFDTGYFHDYAVKTVNNTLHNRDVRALLENRTERFDVVLSDLFEIQTLAGLGALYECPMVWCYSMGAHFQVLRLLGEIPNPAYTGDYFSINQPPFNFRQRIQELWTQMRSTFLKQYWTVPREKALYEQIIGPMIRARGRSPPAYDDIIYNASMVFANDYSYGGKVPYTPQNFKLVAGFHIPSQVDPLPQDLQAIMDNAKYGVIYFSLGSTWQSKQLPTRVIKELLEMFRELKQIVIWKFEEDLTDVPENVKIVHWAPQHGILSHPHCLLFITHGGQLSTIETIHFGVSVIGIPLFFDQHININKAVGFGHAIKVDLNFDLAQSLKTAINMMLTDSKYRRRVKELSMIFHDRPVPPGQELVHWVDHVVRTRGAPHLRSPALLVSWYQKMYLDLAIIVIVSLKVIHEVIRRVVIRLTDRTRQNEVNKKKN